jgi:hypothetical protein
VRDSMCRVLAGILAVVLTAGALHAQAAADQDLVERAIRYFLDETDFPGAASGNGMSTGRPAAATPAWSRWPSGVESIGRRPE